MKLGGLDVTGLRVGAQQVDRAYLGDVEVWSAGAEYIAEVLADNPRAYLRLGESSGTTAADASGNGRTGTYVNTPTLGEPGMSGDGDTAVFFDGSQSERVHWDDGAVWALGTYSIEFWVKGPASGTQRYIFSEHHNSSGNPRFELRRDDPASRLGIIQRDDGLNVRLNVQSNGTVFDNTWHHVVFTDNSGAWAIYIDGSLDKDGTYTRATSTFQNCTLAARRPSGSAQDHLTATLDEVAVFGHVLTPARVAAHFAAASP